MDNFAPYGLGAAGVILAVIVVPLLRWLTSELTASREAFGKFVKEQSEREIAAMARIEEALDRLVARIEKGY